ncbi:aliphatic sulfonate ABC transporter substrate-binding protein [Neorhizobium sp. T786]|uniref:aliphatic sulfonate ABC transporter substrate-binding protein n=1 Tax=Pseudorhizobium xiangyangii TaxID=2883104 RepID=UPI001CFFDD10|nr:aliphatic sulfonate ABC transporter substrate-binding protein [Neorhizobium xiangyangii]MCB5204914.1 aliphatic sulfonate ABC transporter substrate-binding protein [Neorhizobium xiangyangii]
MTLFSSAFPLRRTLLRLALGLSVIPLAGATPTFADDAKPDVIRIGSTAPGHLKFILYRNQKLLEEEFAKDGIKVELTTFDGGSAATVALGSGALDFTYIGNNPSLRLAATGADVKLVGLSSWNRSNETLIVVKPDSPLQTLEDLKGKKVAYLSGTVRHSTFAKALQTAGLSINDIESLNLGIESSAPALARGDVDAIVESTGPAQKLVETGQARVLFDAGKSGKPEWAVPHVVSVNGDFAGKYPEIVTRLLAVDIAAARWADANPEETIGIFVKETGNSDSAVRATYPDGKFFQDPEITDEAVRALQGEEAFMAEAGLLNGKVDYDSWVDRSFYDAALKQVAASN